MKITKDFTYKEFWKSNTALRYEIDNSSTDKKILNSIKILTENILQPLRDEFGKIRITSGYRGYQLNKLVGGSKTSYHVLGMAADIEPLEENVTLIDLIEWIRYNCKYSELIAEYFPEGWVHVAYNEGNFVNYLKLKDKDHHYEVVTLEYIKNLYK